MKRKILSLITTLFLTLGVALSSCSNTTTSTHEHTYSSSYEYDDAYHWHPSTCGHDVQSEKELHIFASSVTEPTYEHEGYTTYRCLVCGYSYTDDEVDALPITITWKNYDGTVLEVDNNVPYGTMPSYDGETPTKESDSNYDYIFAGWTPSVVIATQPTTYVATFSNQEITYTIDFDLNDGTSSSYRGPIKVKTFSKDIFFFDCVKEGWSFRGWEYQNEKIFDEKGNQFKNVVLVDNMIFKAIYTQTVKLTIVSNISEAGVVTGEGEYPYNTYVDVSATPNQGYKFIGWYYQGTLLSNTTDYKYMMWDQDITLEARFELDYFKMRVYSNSEEHGLVLLRSNSNFDYLPEYQEQRKYTSDVTIAAYSKTDVRFLGWYDENNQLVTTNAVYSFVMPNHNYTLEAKWNYFEITYNLNGGVNNENNPTSYSIDDDNITLLAPTKEGYEFVGWKYNDEFIDEINANTIDDITLEAVWSSYKYAIKQDSNGNKYASIIDFDDSIAEVHLPSEVVVDSESIPVKEIGSRAFEDNTTIISIIIPDSVTIIGSYAFLYCSNLTTVTFGENSQLTTIGSYAFYNCSSLTSIVIPNSVTTIGEWAFTSCSNLTTVTIGENSQLTSIGDNAFFGCSNLTTVTIGENSQLTSIGDSAFNGCSNLTSITIPDSVTSIGDNAFSSCSNLTSITIPDSVTKIGSYAFYDCSNLTTVTIGENSQLTSIGLYAFCNCDSLTSIIIPDSVTTIDSYAFRNCSSLTIYCEATSKPSGWAKWWNYSNRPVVWGYVG
ncbi:leucine-rich repeat protein [uncultured Thomasclavelia sp.]|uniref:leucine-rich repeat protein n=1 Tax=uncultured Thomasclavelia sp. TaxID=3025759 RepID=UPI00280B2707|nr:leucine-rich repeat protein [uncultured Thomasclavelia sp.]